MADLAAALSRRGYQVTYVAQREMSVDRAQQGWLAPALQGVQLQLAENRVAMQRMAQMAPVDSIHICQGIRANGVVGAAQLELAKRGLRQWVVMETVQDAGWLGVLKRIEYNRLFRFRGKTLQGVLATGHQTASWVAACGMPASKIYSFAYFLPNMKAPVVQSQSKERPFRFIFAGQLIPRKRVDWLIKALAGLVNQSFELWVVGAGSEEAALRTLATSTIGERVRWMGKLPLPDVPAVMAQVDCLVLPSVHDGWGAVASEALMVGTPVVCSDACGVAGVVRASQQGGVFATDEIDSLKDLLSHVLDNKPIDGICREHLAKWATCLCADAGAEYLDKILSFSESVNFPRPVEPWNL